MGNADDYDQELERLQRRVVDLQQRLIDQGRRVLILFEGRDAAGKDGAIKRLTEFMAPRRTRVVALPKPTEREATQWYFQRYVAHLPAAGETVILNRSWYNRAGVEPVMGFCTPDQAEAFLTQAPAFERALVDDGLALIKLWLDISKPEQAARLAERAQDPLKRFKVSPLDAEAQARWDAYSEARDRMLTQTHSKAAPWTAVRSDDKKTARLNVIRVILTALGEKGVRPDADVVLSGDRAVGALNP